MSRIAERGTGMRGIQFAAVAGKSGSVQPGSSHDASSIDKSYRATLLTIALDSELSAIKLYDLILDSPSVSREDREKLQEILNDERDHYDILKKMLGR